MDDVVKLASDNTHILMWCLGCDSLHAVPVKGEGAWQWNGDLKKPTVAPSILVLHYDGYQPRCHSFITNGEWVYLSDCEHELAGKTVPMIKFKEI